MVRCRYLIGRQHSLTRHRPHRPAARSPDQTLFACLYGRASGGAQNAQTCTSSVMIGLELASAQIGA
jgi:hypothetical protein